MALNTKYTKLNIIPAKLAVRGGGNATYNNEVAQNHTNVGTSVYAQPMANVLYVPFPPFRLAIHHNNELVNKYVHAAAEPRTRKCFVSRYGRNAAVFTIEAVAKYAHESIPIAHNSQ